MDCYSSNMLQVFKSASFCCYFSLKNSVRHQNVKLQILCHWHYSTLMINHFLIVFAITSQRKIYHDKGIYYQSSNFHPRLISWRNVYYGNIWLNSIVQPKMNLGRFATVPYLSINHYSRMLLQFTYEFLHLIYQSVFFEGLDWRW